MPKIPTATKSNGKADQCKENFRELPLDSCKAILLEQHYSHRLPSAVKLCYGELDYGPPRHIPACCVFSLATGRWPEELWELTRLVRLPDYTPPLTKLIGKAMGHIRQHKLIDLVVSFADLEEDHHGGIYQASSWIYDGMREERLDGFNIDGRFTPARTCNATHGTSSIELLRQKLPKSVVEPHFDSGKHCYWKALSKPGMQKALRLGLSSRPYPKPMLISQTAENLPAKAEATRKGMVNLPGLRRVEHRPATRVDAGEELT